MSAAERVAIQPNLYYTQDDLVELLPHFSASYWERGRHEGYGPKYKKPTGKKVLYLGQDVLDWLENSTKENTSM